MQITCQCQKQRQSTTFQLAQWGPKPRSYHWLATRTENRESRSSEHIILAQLLVSGNFQDMQLNWVSLQFTKNHFELSTEMNSSAGSMSSLQEIHLKQGGSYSKLAKISRKALGTTQNEVCYSHSTPADETRDNFREINIFQEEVTVFLPGTAGEFSQLLQVMVLQDTDYWP